jgi:hypothetical protein
MFLYVIIIPQVIRKSNVMIDHLVANAFLLKIPDKYLIIHIDKNPRNNHINNLRYVAPGDAQLESR